MSEKIVVGFLYPPICPDQTKRAKQNMEEARLLALLQKQGYEIQDGATPEGYQITIIQVRTK